MAQANPSREEISQLFVQKIRKKNFWACLFSDFEKVCDPTIPTLEIRLAGHTLLGLVLAYNPDFLRDSFYETEEISLFDFFIAHEGTHVIQRHITRWHHYLVKRLQVSKDKIPRRLHELANIAADLATNSQCWRAAIEAGKPEYYKARELETKLKTELLVTGCWPEAYGLPEDKSMEWYMDALMKEEKNSSEKCKGKPAPAPPPKWEEEPSVDDSSEGDDEGDGEGDGEESAPSHSWLVDDPESLPEEDKPIEGLDKLLESALRTAAQRFEKIHGRGSTPSGVTELLQPQVVEAIKIRWELVVNRLLSDVSEEHDTENFSRPNRRLWGLRDAGVFPFPRYDASPACRAAFLIDTSGSMGLTTEIREVMNLILSFLQYQKHGKFWIVNADTCVSKQAGGKQAVFEIKKKSDMPPHIYGRGGTDFGPPIDWVMENLKPNVIFYGTDGCGPGPDVAPSVPLVWFLTESGRIPWVRTDYQKECPFGGVIKIATGDVIRRP